MSSVARRMYLAWGGLLALAAGCLSSDLPPPLPDAGWPTPVRLESSADRLAVRPGGTTSIQFRLVDQQGQVVPGQALHFRLVASGTDARGTGGAVLAFEEALTDDSGKITLQVIAGPERLAASPLLFTLHADALDASRDVVVSVTDRPQATAVVVPVLSAVTDQPISSVRVFFYDSTACHGLSLRNPPKPQRDSPVLVLGQTTPLSATFSSIAADGSHAVLVQAETSDGTVVAARCVDLLGAGLLGADPMRVPVRLQLLYPEPIGRYAVTSNIEFSNLHGLSDLRSTWQTLSTCGAADPARLWLDCTFAALASSPAVPANCTPPTTLTDPVAQALLSRRGTLGGSRCRATKDSLGRPSLEAMTDALFPSPKPRLLSDLAALPDEAIAFASALRIQSTLDISPATRGDGYTATHTLNSLQLSKGSIQRPAISMTDLAAPTVRADGIQVSCASGQFTLQTDHGFTLRLGTAVRQAFAQASLESRSGPGDVYDLPQRIADSATFVQDGDTLRGCAALDAVLCAQVSAPRGCVVEACQAGLRALSNTLGESFSVLEGDGLDFFFLTNGSSAPLIDQNGDGIADAIGSPLSLLSVTSGPGLWSVELRSRSGIDPAYGSWTAERVP